MELQIKQFWILKEHSTINSANEYGRVWMGGGGGGGVVHMSAVG